jgi:hypothetical protein
MVERKAIQKGLPKSSMKYEPSQFEVIEVQVTRQLPKCSDCHTIGYRRGARACLLRSSNI